MSNPTDADDERPIDLDPHDYVRTKLAARDTALCHELRAGGVGPLAGAFVAASLACASNGPDPVRIRERLLLGALANLDRLLSADAVARGDWRRIANLRLVLQAEIIAARRVVR